MELKSLLNYSEIKEQITKKIGKYLELCNNENIIYQNA